MVMVLAAHSRKIQIQLLLRLIHFVFTVKDIPETIQIQLLLRLIGSILEGK